MSALLKIIQGPNAGAEIALPDGVETTVGKADGCDIVLADPTLPDEPMRFAASADGTTLDGEPLEPLHVVVRGSTALAVGPEGTWGALVWPKREDGEKPDPAPAREADGGKPPAPVAPPPPARPAGPGPGKRSRLRPVLLLALLLLLLFLLGIFLVCSRTRSPTPPTRESPESRQSRTPAAFAARYGLEIDESAPGPAFTGSFATRAERLAATAAAYSEFPGAALDFTDEESLRTAVADALFTLDESGLAVASVSNRTAVLSGLADSPEALSAVLDALKSDVPKLSGVDASAVAFRAPVAAPASASSADAGDAPRRRGPRPPRAASSADGTPALPVCGILATPYPCLVLQDGRRVFPGAAFGGSVVVSIAPDSVVLTNANGSFTWKP